MPQRSHPAGASAMAMAMDTAMDELRHPPSPGHLADMYTSQNGTVVRSPAQCVALCGRLPSARCVMISRPVLGLYHGLRS